MQTCMPVENMVLHMSICVHDGISDVFSAAISACNGLPKCSSSICCVYNGGSVVVVCAHTMLS
jgi:hypothetical protein